MILTLTHPEFLYLRRAMSTWPAPLAEADQVAHSHITMKLETGLSESIRRQRDKIEHPEEHLP